MPEKTLRNYEKLSDLDQKIGGKIRHFRENVYRGGLGVSRPEFVEDMNRMSKRLAIDYDLNVERYRKYEDGFNPTKEVLIILQALGCDLNWLYRVK